MRGGQSGLPGGACWAKEKGTLFVTVSHGYVVIVTRGGSRCTLTSRLGL